MNLKREVAFTRIVQSTVAIAFNGSYNATHAPLHSPEIIIRYKKPNYIRLYPIYSLLFILPCCQYLGYIASNFKVIK
jgi:hypothetical protein